MNRTDLFSILDTQAKQLRQIQSLSSVLVLAGGLPELPNQQRCDCISVLADLTSNALSKHVLIADYVTGINMDEGA